MPGFSYTAVDAAGKETRGSIQADSREIAAEQLRHNGLIPLSIQEQNIFNKELDFTIGKKVRPRDLSVFCRQFVSITQAGVPMKEALQMLGEQTENKWLKKAIADVLATVEKGNTLADAMLIHSDIFPAIMVNMVRAGEASGNLEMAFSRMAVHFEKQAKLRGKDEAEDGGDKEYAGDQFHAEPEGVDDTFFVAGAEVKAADGLEALTEADGGGSGEHGDAGGDAHGGDRGVTVGFGGEV